MDDKLQWKNAWLKRVSLLCLAATAVSLSGCSLFVMAGKFMFGDPKIPSAFKSMSHTDLAKENKRVLVVVSTPSVIKNDFPSLDFDLLDGVAVRLRRRDIDVVNPDDVASWMDDNGGFTEGDDPSELADEFDADYVIFIKLDRFDYREENSPTLFRGRAEGNIFAYKVVEYEKRPSEALEVFVREYRSTYPRDYPVSKDKASERVFRKRYLDRVCEEIAQLFYDHRASETVY